MMRFDPERAAIRFGCGLSPRQSAPATAVDMLAMLEGPDQAAETFDLPGMDAAFQTLLAHRKLRKAVRSAKTDDAREAGRAELKKARVKLRKQRALWLNQTLLRRALSADGFRERLAAFWTDHFTAVGKAGPIRYSQALYADEAIRPHIAGRFSDMLRAVVTHPLMLHYLDQGKSTGPNSKQASRAKRKIGLNENLAREILELHTLGVDGPYTQTDVRQFAELLTGLSYGDRTGFVFRKELAEPGAEQVLGKSYGGGKPSLDAIYAALDDLARHPVTAAHLSWKLAVHFVGDLPNPELVEALRKRYVESDGHLMAVYETLLTHPAAWGTGAGNIKRPIDFIGSSLRALDLRASHMPLGQFPKTNQMFLAPMILMGQSWSRAPGPDGWPEADADWITPQRLAARMQWAMTVPFQLRKVLPDPRDFVEMALGNTAPESVRFAAKAAETRPEGIGLVLASPAFQRM